jgi:phage anti-repressor protein
MNNLIKIESYSINGEMIPAVSARELHAYLGNKAQFSNWIRNRIDQYGFLESVDFVTKENSLELESRGYTPIKKEYFITVDIAKELSMVERTENGKIARKYFIECEKELGAKQAQLPEIRDPQLAMIISMAQSLDAIKTKQEAQKAALEAQNARLDGIEAKNKSILDGSKFYSVAGFASLHGIKIDIKAAATYGRAATAESRALGIMIGSIPDPRFGKVHTYHEDVLAGVFAL